MSRLKLQSYDGEIFEVDIQVANHSSLIKNMLENMKGIDDDNEDPILLPNCHSTILGKVLEYCTFHKNDVLIPDDEKTSLKRSDNLYHWDQEFINKFDQAMLFEIILAANYLDVKGLMEICCKHVANQIKNKTPDEIRSTFHISNDFSEEEMLQINKENEWCEDSE